MSGTVDQYDPTTMFKKWMEQNEWMIRDMQRNFEQLNKNLKDAYSVPADMQRNFEQLNKNLKDAYAPEAWERLSRQIGELSRLPQAWKSFAERAGAQPGIDGMQQMMAAMASYWPQLRGQPFMPNALANWAAFKTSVGSNGRMSIPEAERSALGMREGDLVQVVVFPVPKREAGE